jgi:hypothetical protein
MSTIDDDQPGSDSFWEPGQYKRTVKRVDDGLKLCGQMMDLAKERGDIEAAYAKSLENWSKRWQGLVEKGPEYGTMEASSKGVLEEALKRCELHLLIRDLLTKNVYHRIKAWSKEHYHKHAISSSIKESKELEESFRKAQKPWAKLYTKVGKSRKEYHAACKAERSAINQEKNAQNDTSVSQEQLKKMSEKVDRCKEEKEKLKDCYTLSLDELNKYNPKYMEDMTVVFERAQDMERTRLQFFKEVLSNLHSCLDISADPKLKQIYDDYAQTVRQADSSQDLKWWSQHHGPSMPMNWPEFDEYSPKLQPLNRREKSGKHGLDTGGTGGGGSVTLRQVKPHSATPPPASLPSTMTNGGTGGRGNGGIEAGMTSSSSPVSASTSSGATALVGGSNASSQMSESVLHEPQTPNGGANPYADDWDSQRLTTSSTLIDDGAQGVRVRALYDYEPQEGDELPLKKGEILEKLEDEDNMGWCKGRKDGRVGLYPANYVELAGDD